MTRNWGFVCDGSNGTHLCLMFMDEMSLGVLDKLTQKISWWGDTASVIAAADPVRGRRARLPAAFVAPKLGACGDRLFCPAGLRRSFSPTGHETQSCCLPRASRQLAFINLARGWTIARPFASAHSLPTPTSRLLTTLCPTWMSFGPGRR